MKYLSPFKPGNAARFLTLAFGIFCCALFFSGQSLQAQTTRTVCASGCDFTTIAAAVAASANGDIIHVNTALHTEISVAIANKNLTIKGNGIASTTVQGAASRSTAAGRIFTISGTSVVTIEDMKIQHGNSATGGAMNIAGTGSFSANRVHFYRNDALSDGTNIEGGAINSSSGVGHSLSFIQCIFEENRCATAPNTSRGGAIHSAAVTGAGTFTLSKCTFLNNSAVNTGGAINGGSGAIAWTVSDCTFEGNSVTSPVNGNGGAINSNAPFAGGISGCLFKNNSAGLNGGAIRFSSSGSNAAVLTNCTFVGNTAADGAGLWRQTSATSGTRIVNCTFSQNTASGNGSGIYFNPTTGSVFQIVNSIFNHPSKDIYVGAAFGAFTGSTKNYGNSSTGISGAPTLAFDYNSGNSTLGLNTTLANNGGPTQTLELLATSTLRNVGVNTATDATVPIKDQRNYSRTDAGIDLGAYERDGVVDNADAPVITYTALANDPSTSDRTLTATITDANGVYPFAALAADLRPRIYFRKNAGSWNSSAGSLTSGNGRNGTWTFTISAATMGGLVATDQVCYYVIAEDVSTPVNISSNPAGVVATSVNNVTTPPTPNCYTIGAASNPTVNLSVSANTGTEAAATGITITATASAPVSGNQTVTLGVSGTGVNSLDYILSSTTITILSGNTTGSVTFTILNDAFEEGNETATLTISGPSAGIALGATTTQNISITDDDDAGVIITESGGSTNVTEGGATDTYTVRLASAPTANVTITITPDAQVSTSPSPSLTFTTLNWNTNQTVTVTAVNDAVVEGPHMGTIQHSATSGDANYNGITIGNVVANITDNDVAVSPTLGMYHATSLDLGSNTTVTPDAAPTNTSYASATTTADFKGQLEVDPLTGVVRITNAHPAGTYPVTVTAYAAGGSSTTRSFSLTVNTVGCISFNANAFASALNLGVRDFPYSIAVGDFNGDGLQDLTTSSSFNNNISVLLRKSDNTGFETKVDYGVGTQPFSVAVGDFNGDGRQDLAVANRLSATVSVLLRKSDNTGFAAKVDYGVGDYPIYIAVGDFNGDGRLDLAVANANSNNVSVLLRKSDNTDFETKVDYGVGVSPTSVVLGDFNSDGLKDLAVANYLGNNVSVLLRKSDNTGFETKVDYGVGNEPYSFAAGDFNSDGRLDLAVANLNNDNVSVLLRKSDNTGFETKVDYGTGDGPYSIAAGDFNGDGRQDLAVANIYSNNVSVLLRKSDNTGFEAKVDFGGAAKPTSIAVGDFNGDGRQDLAVANYDNATVSVLERLGSPTLAASPGPAIITNSTCSSGCILAGGNIAAPSGTCPSGSTLQYKVGTGAWSNTLPTYNQTTAQTIKTRCSCDADPRVLSDSSAVTTVPGTISNPVVPANGASNVACLALAIAPTLPVVTGCDGSTLTPSGPSIVDDPSTITCEGTRTYTYTYSCGTVSSTWSYVYTIERVPFTVPSDGASTVACLALATAPTLPTVTSNCGETLTPAQPVITDNPSSLTCEGTRTYTYMYTDCEGNTATWSFVYTIERLPFTVPSDGASTVACLALATAPTLPTVTSNCGETLTAAQPVITDNPSSLTCEGTRTYAYTYTDCEGNTATWSFVYTIERLPFTVPNDGASTVACLALATAPTLPTITSNCGETLTPAQPVITDNPSSLTCEGTRTYAYTYTDCEGNTATWSFVYTIERLPFTVPNDGASTVACLALATAPTLPTVTSNCGETLTPAAPVITDNPSSLTCEGTRTYAYTYTDCEGNTATWSYVYTIERLPFTVPNDGASTVACLALATAPTLPTVTSNCGETLTPAQPVITDNPSSLTCEGTRTYAYTYTDCEGNTATWSYVYTIEREPFTVPSDGASTVACLALATAPTLPTVTSNCGETLTPAQPVITDNPSSLTCEGTRTYAYTYTDCEGNTATWRYVYTIEREPFTVPADGAANVTCLSEATQPTPPAVTSNCGETLIPTGPVVTTNPSQLVADGTKTYTWTYTDCEGNTQTWKFVYTIQDNTPPSITCPQDIEVCEGTIVTYTAPVGTDNCAGATTVQTAGLPSGSIFPIGTTTNTFVVTAANGQINTCSFTVTVNPLPSVSIDFLLFLCKDSTILLSSTVNGGTGPFIYSWTQTGGAGSVQITNNNDGTASAKGLGFGAVTISFSVQDANGCNVQTSATRSLTVVDCSASNYMIKDPCTCKGNNLFDEKVSLSSPFAGETWTVASIAPLRVGGSSPQNIAVGNTLTYNNILQEYEISFVHVDSSGYVIVVEGPNAPGSQGNVTLSTNNICYYPDVAINNLPALVSPNSAPFTVTGTGANNAAGTGTFKLNGAPQAGASPAPTQMTINPGTLPLGINTLEYSFDAGTAGSKNLNDPGCVKAITKTFQVANCGCQDVTVSLNENCQFLLTGNLVSDAACGGGTVRVMDNDPSNGGLIDCAGVWTYGLFDAFGNIICWGKVTAEDKTAPVLVCAPADFTLDCYDVNYVLNNRLTIGNVGATSSPRPAATSPQTINNAEGVAGTGDNCQLGLAPPSLVSDNIKNLGYAYFKDNCYNCGCRISLKWSDKVEFYSCEQMKVNGGYYAVISREWTATDCNGMRSSYVQKIKFTRPTLDDFVFNGPGEGKYDRVVEYNSCTPDKSLIKKEDVTPYVCSYFNTSANPRCLFIDQVECNYSVQIKDTEFPICGGKGVKIDRELYVLDWCAGGIVDTFHILIKIGDFQAPTVEYAHGAPYDISTGPMDCTAAIPVSVVGIKTAFGVTIKDNCNLGNISVSVYTKDRYVKGILVYEGPEDPLCNDNARGGELRGDHEDYQLGACDKEDICWDKVEYAVMNGMMIGLPVGKHLMVIDAFDGCYNASTTCFVFEVKDKIAPIMKCDDDLHVTLSNANGYTNGYAQVSAADIDEGSWDNCKLAWIAVRRNVPDACAASFIQKGYDTNNNGKLDALPADGDVSKADGFDRNGDGDIADFGETFILKGGKLMTPMLDFVEFFCCDLTERVTVELWGGDIYGNTNYCWMDLLIEDKVAPTCLAPWDVTVYCDDKNLASIDSKEGSAAAFGDVTIPTGNDCAALDTVYSTEKKLKCGAGYIDRIWTLTKQTVKGPISVTCKQRIHILPFHEYNICFPKDVSTDCKTPIIDTVITDELGCDILAVNVHDKRYDASDDECYKIFRTYSVINWCTYDDRCGDPLEQTNIHIIDRAVFGNYGKAPIYMLVRDREDNRRDGIEEFYISKDLTANNADDIRVYPYYCEVAGEFYHSFIYTQIIKVYDDTRPVVTGVRDTFCTSPTACTANITKVVTLKDNCTDKVELETQFLMIAPFQTLEAGKMILYSTPRWSTKDLGNGQFEIKVSNLPEGTHDLIVVGRDECGNLSLPTRIPFTVKDCKAPAPICINGLSTGIMPDGNGGGMMAVWATDFVASKIYDCNGQGPETKDGLKLITKYSINRVGQPVNKDQTGLNFTCTDITNSPILVELHAWDEAGNHDFCITFVELIDSRGVCPGSATGVNIAGTISTEGNANLQGASITLSGAASQSATTAANGGYSFVNLSKGGDFTVTPQLDKNHLNGVSTFDLVLIQKHILGVQALNSPYKMIAADANNSKTISTLDLIALRKLILNIDTHFANNTSWRFVDATYVFPNPGNPWSAAFPEVVSINDIASNVTANFVAIKVGDVNASASVNGATSAEIRTSEDFKLKTQEQNLKSGNEYKVTFSAEDLKNIQGYQFALNLDQSKVELLDIEYGVAKAENFGVFKNEGIITTSWNSKYEPGALFTLVLRAKADAKLSSTLSLNRLVHPEAYDQNNENLGIALSFEGIQATEAYELRQNTPNPFNDETLIGFSLPKALKGTLTVRDVKGALVYKVEGNYAKGNNQVSLKKSQLGASGVLYYTLETRDFTATKKMVILE